MIRRITSIICYLILSLQGATAFAGVTSNRVFVGTPVSNFPKHLVSERMTPTPKTLYADMLVDDAIALLMSWGVSGAPVVDFKTGTMLLGVVSSYDFLQKEAFEGVLLAMEGTSEMVSSYVDAAKKICGQQVGDIMTPNPRTVFPTTTMRVAAELMSNEKLHHLPVVDDKGALLGILTPSDVMMDLVHVVRNLPEHKEEDDDVDVNKVAP